MVRCDSLPSYAAMKKRKRYNFFFNMRRNPRLHAENQKLRLPASPSACAHRWMPLRIKEREPQSG